MAHVVSVVSMFMAKPGCAHYEALKCVLRYLNWTIWFDLMYKWFTHNKVAIDEFVDVDYLDNIDTIKALSGYVFTLFGIVVC